MELLHRFTVRVVLVAIFILSSSAYTARAEPIETTAGEFALADKVIVVDAGHGGPDSGARSSDGIHEKDVALSVARRVSVLLHEAGAIVYMTRTEDEDFATDEDTALGRRHQSDLRNRTRYVRSKSPDVFLSVHCNAVPSPAWSGAHTIYMEGNPEGERLAKLMQIRFKELLLPTKREADDMSTLYLLKRVPGPAVLAEIGFLSNPTEAHQLLKEKYQDRVAFAMYLSVLDYFHKPATPEGEETYGPHTTGI